MRAGPGRPKICLMQVDTEYLREQYANLTDAALLAIRRNELVPAAQKCYDEELRRRGLRTAESAPIVTSRATDFDIEEELTSEDAPEWLDEASQVYSAVILPGQSSTDEITSARDALERAGVPCYIETLELPPSPDRDSRITHEWRLLVPGTFNLRATSVLDKEIFNANFESEWRAHLEHLSDEDFLRMTPEVAFAGLYDRLERVQRVYEEEARRRRLSREY
jgi:hypothetical protein